VSAWAGHADLSMAQRVYVHPSPKDLEQGRDALAALLSPGKREILRDLSPYGDLRKPPQAAECRCLLVGVAVSESDTSLTGVSGHR